MESFWVWIMRDPPELDFNAGRSLSQIPFRVKAHLTLLTRVYCACQTVSLDAHQEWRCVMRNEISQPSPNSQLEQPVELSQGFIIEEVMRKLQVILDQKPKEPRWKRFLTHPVVLLIVSALLGGAITLVYSAKQNQLAAERSFSVELVGL